jgi:hypothetical protein
MKFTLLLLSTLTASTFANAQAQDDYLSVGISALNISGDYTGGVGITGAKIEDGKQLGIIGSFDVTKRDDAVIYDFFVGPVYRPESHQWLRLYPLVGFGYYYLDGNVEMDGGHYQGGHYDRPGFAYGAGLQVSVPNSSAYLELNHKRIAFPNELKDFTFDVTYLGFGYNF